MTVVYWLYDETCSDPWADGYIGVSVDYVRRFKEHISTDRFPKDVEIKILFEGTEDECLEQERQYRPEHYIGWNIMDGGGKPPVFERHTDATKEKMRKIAAKRKPGHYDKSLAAAIKANIGRKQPLEERQKRSRSMMGKNTWTKGTTQTEEANEKRRQKMKGRCVTPGWKISQATKGKPRPWQVGKKQSTEWIEKKAAACRGKKPIKISCEKCGKQSAPGMHKRWHGQNCREEKNVTG